MNSLKDTALESNPYLKINFDGGDLSLQFSALPMRRIVTPHRWAYAMENTEAACKLQFFCP